MSIREKLIELEQSNIYPFHMPGHKRNPISDSFPYGMDITEIYGFDDLHEPEGILKAAQDKAAEIYAAKEAFYLVNGSTCGILAAISAAVPVGGTVLVARNCHKAVYHAIQLRGAKAIYLYPKIDEYGIAGPIEVSQIKAALEGMKACDACILTSPTYEGIISNIPEIAEVLHQREIPLIVDEAHGAHFGFHPYFPKNATGQGADAVIVSIHKTLPAPTQTAILLNCSDRIESEKLKLYLDIYETSSPSYVLMSAMESALDYAKANQKAWDLYCNCLVDFYEKAEEFTNIKVKRMDDPSKIVVLGEGLAEKLRKQSIEVEMESLHYAILMTSMMDNKEAFDHLLKALKSIDCDECGKSEEQKMDYSAIYEKANAKLCISEAVEAEKRDMPLLESTGEIAGEYIYLYPPGIPLLGPGEVITDDAVKYIEKCEAHGLQIKGQARKGRIYVVK